MADLRPIPTPLAYRWRRFLQNFLPIVMFLIAVLLTIWLWDRQSQMGNAIGVAEARFVDVPSGSAGILMPPGHGEWREFQTVKKGEVIGEVRLAQTEVFAAQVVTIQKEKEKVLADMVAAREQFLLEMQLQHHGQWYEIARLYWQVEEFRHDYRDRETRIKTAEAQIRTINATLGFNERSRARGGAISEQAIVQNQMEVKQLEQLVSRELEAKEVVRSDLIREYKRLKDVNEQHHSQNSEQQLEIRKVVQALAAPFAKELEVLDARTQEIQAATNSLVIRAPTDGVVASVFAVPGQSVQPGDPVIRIASENSDYIVTYVRHRHRIYPVPNMAVKLRSRHTGSRPIDSYVVKVGAQVVPVPLEHLVDPARPEFGYPISIALPDDLQPLIKPGEQIDIIFPSRAEKVVPRETSSTQSEVGV